MIASWFMNCRLPLFLLAIFCVVAPLCLSGADSPPSRGEGAPPFIILKLDDLSWQSPAWTRVIQFLEEKNIKSSIGIVGNSLDRKNQGYHDWIRSLQAKGLVEFWNHGLDHKQWKESGRDVCEFQGTSYEHQKEHFERAQELSREVLGEAFRTFGAPFNQTDETTKKILAENPDLKVWLFGDAKANLPGVLVLDRTPMNIENPTFVPNLDHLKKEYQNRNKNRDVFVIQGHPNNWTDARFADFVKIVEYLQEQGVTFTTPFDYYLYRQSSAGKAAHESVAK